MIKLNQPIFHLDEGITEEQIQFFHKVGLIQFKNFISKDFVATLLHEIKKVETHFLEMGIDKVNGVPMKFGWDTDGSSIIQRMVFVSKYSEILSKFMQDKRIMSIARLLEPYEGRIGENEKDGLVVNHYINTEESCCSKLGWHTDCLRDIFLGQRILPMLNVGLHLDDCPISNGGLRVIPGTHKQGLLPLLFKKKYFINNKPDPDEAGIDIEAGDLTVHEGRIWHRVEESPYSGEQSRRRVMYFPFITGPCKPKNESEAHRKK
jgi:ectoine hydroxylase-related dioxygenase (phytanoyl-CoA dioxygenase family)